MKIFENKEDLIKKYENTPLYLKYLIKFKEEQVERFYMSRAADLPESIDEVIKKIGLEGEYVCKIFFLYNKNIHSSLYYFPLELSIEINEFYSNTLNVIKYEYILDYESYKSLWKT